MKIKLIEDRCKVKSGYTVGNIYHTSEGENPRLYYLTDDDGDTRFINKSLIGSYWDWEIVK